MKDHPQRQDRGIPPSPRISSRHLVTVEGQSVRAHPTQHRAIQGQSGQGHVTAEGRGHHNSAVAALRAHVIVTGVVRARGRRSDRAVEVVGVGLIGVVVVIEIGGSAVVTDNRVVMTTERPRDDVAMTHFCHRREVALTTDQTHSAVVTHSSKYRPTAAACLSCPVTYRCRDCPVCLYSRVRLRRCRQLKSRRCWTDR